MIFEWNGRKHNFAIEEILAHSSRLIRWSFYYILIGLILGCFIFNVPQEFIYFQF
jgi:hypothetical protein